MASPGRLRTILALAAVPIYLVMSSAGCGGDHDVVEALQAARVDASKSLDEFSHEAGLKPEETRSRYCHLLELFELEGSDESFASWAAGALGLNGYPRYRVEGAIGELGNAVREAEEGDDLTALTHAVCIG